MSRPKRTSRARWLRLILFVGALTGLAAVYRFALRYRERVGLPGGSPVETSPREFGLAFEDVAVSAGDHDLTGWFVPAAADSPPPRRRRAARATAGAAAAGAAAAESGPAAATGAPPLPGASAGQRPGIVIVHGWESNRGRTFAHVRYLYAAGFHCLVFDVRGHGDNPAETLPMNVPEFAEDTVAAVHWLAARPEVSAVGVLGHSLGAAGAIVAAAREPAIAAVASLSAPADLVRMTRRTFDMAEMKIPEPVATPLAWITAAVLLAPRRHSLADASAVVAAAKYRGPLLLVHGAQDHGVPADHVRLIERAATDSRGPDDPKVEVLILPEFGHRWLYEDAGCRRKIAEFFAASLGGPVPPEEAGGRAAACVVVRPADPVYGFGAQATRNPPTGPETARTDPPEAGS